MAKNSDLPKSQRHVLIYDEDWEYLELAYGPGSAGRFGIGKAVCVIIHAKVKALKEEQAVLANTRRETKAKSGAG